MLRSMSHGSRRLATAVAVAGSLAASLSAGPATAARAQETRPVVVVFTFTNSSIGANRADFDGIATGVQDLLITDMASNAKIRLVDRSRINDVLQEQNLAKSGMLDNATAIRVGKILGAQYAVTGGFIATGKGQAVLTGRTIDLETTQIATPEKITGSADDVLGMIGQLSTKLASDMNLTPKAGRRVGDAGASDASKTAPAQAGEPAAKTAPASKPGTLEVEHFAKAISQPEKLKQTKLDVATMKLYSNALDEVDKKNKAKAIELFKQVLAKYEGFEPAQRQLDKLSH
jgi:TolB-like protein